MHFTSLLLSVSLLVPAALALVVEQRNTVPSSALAEPDSVRGAENPHSKRSSLHDLDGSGFDSWKRSSSPPAGAEDGSSLSKRSPIFDLDTDLDLIDFGLWKRGEPEQDLIARDGEGTQFEKRGRGGGHFGGGHYGGGHYGGGHFGGGGGGYHHY
ncbi:hypothetical protein JCM11491_003648 [Sporobolomyces phaffii]